MKQALDLWFINPRDQEFQEPSFHEKDLNNLEVLSDRRLFREEINQYFDDVKKKIFIYLSQLKEELLLEFPHGCEYCRFTLILAQFRHLHTHMGMIMGFIIDDENLWSSVLGLEMPFSEEGYSKYM